MTDTVSRDSSAKPAPAVAKPNAGHPAAVPDHAFEASIAGEEDPGASLDNNANGVPPPKDTSSSATGSQSPAAPASTSPAVHRPNSHP